MKLSQSIACFLTQWCHFSLTEKSDLQRADGENSPPKMEFHRIVNLWFSLCCPEKEEEKGGDQRDSQGYTVMWRVAC